MDDNQQKYKYPKKELDSLLRPKEDSSNDAKEEWTIIHCPQCNQQASADNINLDKLIAKCNQCNAVFSFQDDITQIKVQPLPVEIVNMPDGIAEMDHGYGKELWCNLKPNSNYYVLAFLAAFFVVFCFGFLYWTRLSGKGPLLLLDIAFSIFGIMGLYSMIDLLLKGSRYTKIKIDDYRLTLEHPGLKKTTVLNLEDVEKVHLNEHKTSDLDGHQKSVYNIICTTKGGDELKLLKNLALKSQAMYVIQEINRYIKT